MIGVPSWEAKCTFHYKQTFFEYNFVTHKYETVKVLENWVCSLYLKYFPNELKIFREQKLPFTSNTSSMLSSSLSLACCWYSYLRCFIEYLRPLFNATPALYCLTSERNRPIKKTKITHSVTEKKIVAGERQIDMCRPKRNR